VIFLSLTVMIYNNNIVVITSWIKVGINEFPSHECMPVVVL